MQIFVNLMGSHFEHNFKCKFNCAGSEYEKSEKEERKY